MKKEKITQEELRNLIRDLSKNATEYTQVKIINKIIIDGFNLLSGSIAFALAFEECIFLKKFDIGFSKIEQTLSFKHCYFLSDVGFVSTTFLDHLFIVDCKLKGHLLLLESTVKEFMVDLASCKSLYISHDCKLTKTSLNGRENFIFDEIRLNINAVEGNFYLSNFNCKKLIFDSAFNGLQTESQLEIFKCKINSFYLNDINNSGVLKLNYIQSLSIPNEPSFFTISKSNLGKAEFIQFDFASFDEINILNSFLGECIFINTAWGYNNINVFEGKEMNGYLKDREVKNGLFRKSVRETRLQLTHKKDIYKQIKYALSKQGDFVNEKKFYSLEMTTYSRSLPLTLKNLSTKIILWLSKITSNYGLSLGRPILLILTNILPFYLLVYFGKIPGVYPSTVSDTNCRGIINGMAQFFFYLNPVRKFETDINGFLLISDIWIRIISSYAIYNIIRATRRFIN